MPKVHPSQQVRDWVSQIVPKFLTADPMRKTFFSPLGIDLVLNRLCHCARQPCETRSIGFGSARSEPITRQEASDNPLIPQRTGLFSSSKSKEVSIPVARSNRSLHLNDSKRFPRCRGAGHVRIRPRLSYESAKLTPANEE